jgi:hypothetical protein
MTRSPGIMTQKQQDKAHLYNMAYFYLVGIKRRKISPGASIINFLREIPGYTRDPETVNALLDAHSSRPERLPQPGQAFDHAASDHPQP